MLSKDLKNKIIDTLKQFDPDKIILFGSHVYGKPDSESDIDLLIVKNIPKEQVKELRLRIKKTLWQNFKENTIYFDVLVDSEERILKRIKMGDLFYEEIYKLGEEIYA
ncbi:nucleotidyltransferase domain-containing protein [Bacteroidota bacterium]